MPPSSSDSSSSISFILESTTSGYPAIVDAAFSAALQASKAGGTSTFQYFDALNKTSDFWGAIASQQITFAPATDPNDNPVSIASSGNVDMQLAASYTASSSEPPPVGTVVGVVTIKTMNTTTMASQMTAMAVRLATMPAYLPLSAALFRQLVVPLYKNAQGMLTRLSSSLQTQTQTENPDIDPDQTADDVLSEQSELVEQLDEELVSEGLSTMSIEWGSVLLSAAGLAPLMALPMIAEFLGHQLYHAMIVQNLTGTAFNWSIPYQDSGSVAVKPGSASLSAQTTFTDPGSGTSTTLSYQGNFQFINSSDYGSIGYVLALTSADETSSISTVIAIPWSGENTIWTGTSTDSAEALYQANSAPNGQLSQTAAFGAFQLTVSINALQGKTAADTYYYCSTVIIEPSSSSTL